MIYTTPGSTFTANTEPLASGLVGTIGVRIIQGATTILARTTSGIAETPAGSGIYTASGLAAPPNGGSYLVVWDVGTKWLDEELIVTYSTPGAVTPSGQDLCTIADVKALMQKIGPNAGSQDALIQQLITRASIKIMRDIGREFVPGGANALPYQQATRTFEYSWEEQFPAEAFVDLRPYDLNATQSQPLTVVADTDQSSPNVLSVDEWRLWPQPPREGVYKAIKVSPIQTTTGLIGWAKRQIQVTGDWGFPSIPFEATQACVSTVIWWLTSYPAARQALQTDASQGIVAPRSYPMDAVDLLNTFRRMTV